MTIRFLQTATILAGVLGVLIFTAPAEAKPPVRSLAEFRDAHLVRQNWELSCGAASLATILRYQLGIPVTERVVALGLVSREAYLSNPDILRLRQGFSLLDMKRYVDSQGLEGIGLGQLTFDDLLERAPLIVPVNTRGYPHFVVFKGATRGEVLLADPAFGNLTLSRQKFEAGWISYRDLGRVGFLVAKGGVQQPPGALSPQAMELVMLRAEPESNSARSLP